MTACKFLCESLCLCVFVLFLLDASVLVGEKASLRRGNGSFVFLLILPVDTRVADLLGDLCSAAGEGLLSGLSTLSWMIIFTSNSKRWVQKEGSFMQSAPHPLRG